MECIVGHITLLSSQVSMHNIIDSGNEHFLCLLGRQPVIVNESSTCELACFHGNRFGRPAGFHYGADNRLIIIIRRYLTLCAMNNIFL